MLDLDFSELREPLVAAIVLVQRESDKVVLN